MKKFLLNFLLMPVILLMTHFSLSAQDLVVLNSGDSIKVVVIQADTNLLTYAFSDNGNIKKKTVASVSVSFFQQGYYRSKMEDFGWAKDVIAEPLTVVGIRKENGIQKYIFNKILTGLDIPEVDAFQYLTKEEKDSIQESKWTTDEVINKAFVDANQNYKKYKAASILTGVSGFLLTPIGGLIPASICGYTPPKPFNLTPGNTRMMKNPIYRKSYEKTAARIKRKRVWQAWSISFSTYLLVGYYLLNN